MTGTAPIMGALQVMLHGLSTVFESLGRALICLGPDFRVVHGSSGLDRIAGAGAAEAVRGLPVEEVFGPEGNLRQALLAGERPEGWAAVLIIGRPRRVSLTAAPIAHDPSGICDLRVAYVIVLHPEDEGEEGERRRFQAALASHQWRRDATARALGISRTTLWRKMRELGL